MLQVIRIVIVDDDENMRKIISRHIEKAKELEDTVEICAFSMDIGGFSELMEDYYD